ncbi:hypothetical protein [Staphylococcus phage PT94]
MVTIVEFINFIKKNGKEHNKGDYLLYLGKGYRINYYTTSKNYELITLNYKGKTWYYTKDNFDELVVLLNHTTSIVKAIDKLYKDYLLELGEEIRKKDYIENFFGGNTVEGIQKTDITTEKIKEYIEKNGKSSFGTEDTYYLELGRDYSISYTGIFSLVTIKLEHRKFSQSFSGSNLEDLLLTMNNNKDIYDVIDFYELEHDLARLKEVE